MLKPPAPFGHGRTNNRSIRNPAVTGGGEREKTNAPPGSFLSIHTAYALRVDALVFAPFKSLNLNI